MNSILNDAVLFNFGGGDESTTVDVRDGGGAATDTDSVCGI